MQSIPGLNTRETALVLWVGGFAVWAAVKDGEVRASLAAVVKVLLMKWIVVVLVASAMYAAAMVVVLQAVGYWTVDMTKTTIYWFVATALVSSLRSNEINERDFRELVLLNVSVPFVVEFLVNLHTFPLIVELVLVPLAIFVALTEFVARTQVKDDPRLQPVIKFLGAVLVFLVVLAVVFSLNHVLGNLDELATRQKAAEFFLPLILTFVFIPFLYGLAVFGTYQGTLAMTRFGMKGDRELYRFARREIWDACGLSLRRVRLFERRYRAQLFGERTREDVERVLAAFRDEAELMDARPVRS